MVKKMLNPVVMAAVIVIIYTTVPILSVFIRSYLTTYSYMIVCVFLFGFILLTGGMERLSFIAYAIFPAIIYVICTFFTRNESITLWGYQSLLILLPFVVGYYFIYYRDYAVPVFTKILIVALIITAITTIIGVIRFPEAARILATIETSDDQQSLTFGWNNIGGYSFVYICVLLYPILMLAYKQRRISRAAFLTLFILMFSLVILTEYTTALLLVMISSILYFTGKKSTPSQLLITGIALFTAYLLFQSLFRSFFLWLADVLGSDIFSERLTALAGGITGIENSESNRVDLYRLSIDAFLESPLFGSIFKGKMVGGGHSFILDCLANYGLLGGVTIVLIYRNIYRLFFAPFKYERGYGLILWTFVQSVILSLFNTGMWLNVLTLFVPVLLSSIYYRYGDDGYEDSLDS